MDKVIMKSLDHLDDKSVFGAIEEDKVKNDYDYK